MGFASWADRRRLQDVIVAGEENNEQLDLNWNFESTLSYFCFMDLAKALRALKFVVEDVGIAPEVRRMTSALFHPLEELSYAQGFR